MKMILSGVALSGKTRRFVYWLKVHIFAMSGNGVSMLPVSLPQGGR